MTLIHGAATRTIAAYARVRGDRPRKGRVEVDGAEEETRGAVVSKPVRNSEREQRGCAEAVSSLFSAPASRPTVSAVAFVVGPLWRAEFLFSLKGAPKKYTVAI